jgi:hypothetical protein
MQNTSRSDGGGQLAAIIADTASQNNLPLCHVNRKEK